MDYRISIVTLALYETIDAYNSLQHTGVQRTLAMVLSRTVKLNRCCKENGRLEHERPFSDIVVLITV
jgi:hypothetical protein